MNKPMRAALAALVLAALPPATEARVRLEGIYVYSEDAEPVEASCSLRRANLTPVVHAAMCAKGIPAVGSSKDTDLHAYIMLNVLKVADVCSVYYGIQFYVAGGSALYGQSQKRLYGALELCNESGLMTGAAAGLQDRVAREIGRYADMCIDKSEKKNE